MKKENATQKFIEFDFDDERDVLKIRGDYVESRNIENSLIKIHFIDEKGDKCFVCFRVDENFNS